MKFLLSSIGFFVAYASKFREYEFPKCFVNYPIFEGQIGFIKTNIFSFVEMEHNSCQIHKMPFSIPYNTSKFPLIYKIPEVEITDFLFKYSRFVRQDIQNNALSAYESGYATYVKQVSEDCKSVTFTRAFENGTSIDQTFKYNSFTGHLTGGCLNSSDYAYFINK